jgi:hypothetical protein
MYVPNNKYLIQKNNLCLVQLIIIYRTQNYRFLYKYIYDSDKWIKSNATKNAQLLYYDKDN